VILFLSLALAVLQQPQDSKPARDSASGGETRCVVVDRLRREPYDGLVGPQLVIMSDGTYVATVEQRGHYGSHVGTFLFRSTDKGASWSKVATFEAPCGVSLFEDGGALYLMGVEGSGNGPIGWPVICRSTDHGQTWSKPVDEATGILRGETTLGSCAGPAVIRTGRLWRAFTRGFVPPGATRRVHALVASAALGSDLLNAGAWRWSTELPLDGLKGIVWEGSYLVADGEGPPSLVLRSMRDTRGVASPSADGFDLKKREPAPGWITCDALGARLERDARSQQFLTLCAFPDSTLGSVPPSSSSSEVSLLASRDLVAWDLRTNLLRGDPHARFTCADWAIDGGDLVVVIGGSLGDGVDALALLFLRVPSFRERRFGDPPAPGPAPGR
jgi:hypothetical protein